MRHFVLTLLFFAGIATLATAHAEELLRDNLRSTIFDEASNALGNANEAMASVLAPETYRRAGVSYKKAQEAFDSKESLDKVRKLLAEATGEFTEATIKAKALREAIPDTVQARADASNVDAQTRAAKNWEKAEIALYEAASRAERGRQSRVESYSDKAQELYREAELEAIETALFNEIEAAIKEAKRLDADDWAPKSYQYSIDLLAQARSELTSNRYDTDRPRDLANQALHYAKHAAYVSRQADDIDDNDLMLEDLLMDWEAHIRRLALDLDIPVHFDAGPQRAIDAMSMAVQERQRRTNELISQLTASNNTNQILRDEITTLSAEMENQETAKARLSDRLAAEQRREDRVRRVENLFGENEAQVLRESNQLVIRMIGLNFSSGSANIETQHYALLSKLQTALSEFPEAPITIEGHTDSYGEDAKNLSLSIARADSVVNYLLANTPISPTKISAVGYGESKPIANNETTEGRARNRRIDVVIYP
jgi:outer membrane protein OmpA-like peptidoglycan-associated protein